MTTSDNGSTPSASRQLSLFETAMDNRIRRVEIDGVMHFSILDTFEYSGSIGSAKNPSAYWKRAQKRLAGQGGNLTGVLDYQFTASDNRKKKETPVAPFKFFLRLVQVVEIAEWEHIRQWMADVAHERMEEDANPVLGIRNAEKRLAYHKSRYIAAQLSRGESLDAALEALPERMEAIDTYKTMMAEVKRLNERANYGQLVNAEYVNLFQHTSDQLKTILNNKSVRDALPPMQLSYVKTTEQSITMLLKNANNMSNEQLHKAFVMVSQRFGDMLAEFCDMAGVDRVTGKPLMTAKVQ